MASTRVWQVTVPADDVYASMIETPAKVARQAFPNLGNATLKEGQESSIERHATVLQVGVVCEDFESASVDAAFERAVATVQELQYAYYITTSRLVTLVTQENLPPLTLIAKRDPSAPGGGSPTKLGLYMPNVNLEVISSREPLNGPQNEAFEKVLSSPQPEPLLPFAELMAEGDHALRKRGDYRTAVILHYSASEVLLDMLLMHVLWEEGYGPEEAAAEFFSGKKGFSTRLRKYYHTRFGGNWGDRGDGPLAAWKRDLADLRHRVLHAGYRPERDEAYTARESLHRLRDFVNGRLAKRAASGTYPRTGVVFLGEEGLKQYQGLTPRIGETMNDPREVPWRETFLRWRWVLNDQRKKSETEPAVGGYTVTVLVMDSQGQSGWWLHDRNARKVRPCHEPDGIPTNVRSRFAEVGRELQEKGAPGQRASFAWMGPHPSPIEGTPWRREHEVLPLHGLMVDGSDYSAGPAHD